MRYTKDSGEWKGRIRKSIKSLMLCSAASCTSAWILLGFEYAASVFLFMISSLFILYSVAISSPTKQFLTVALGVVFGLTGLIIKTQI